MHPLRRRLLAASSVSAAAVFGITVALAAFPAIAAAGIGGGSGGLTGGAIWAEAWWQGAPTGPGPWVPGASGGRVVCVWHDLGPTLLALNTGLSEASIPKSFFSAPQGGGHPGIWGVDAWALARSRRGPSYGHFDLIACSNASGVPQNGGDVDTVLPLAYPPHTTPKIIWLFWDDVPDPPSQALPPVVHAAFAMTHLPVPTLHTSPSELAGTPDATVVNFPTWLWVGSGIWHTYYAVAEAGGYVATVWAIPESVHWSASWDFPNPADDPEHGTTLGAEVLDKTCAGPGAAYNPGLPASTQQSACTFDFADSTFGTRQRLSATVTRSVYWALSSPSGVVGGEGSLGTAETAGSIGLRVLQVESILTRG
jgi:hypothetical protein